MLVDFLKGNHFELPTATVPWLWEAKGPACCHLRRMPHELIIYAHKMIGLITKVVAPVPVRLGGRVSPGTGV
jgi:hypothetical protein